MENDFYERPIFDPPYAYPTKPWELNAQGQPTQRNVETRRRAEFISPIPKPEERRAAKGQQQLAFDEGNGLPTQEQQCEVTAAVNEIRRRVGQWRSLPNPQGVTPETAGRGPGADSRAGGAGLLSSVWPSPGFSECWSPAF